MMLVPPKHFLSAGKPKTKPCVRLIARQPTHCTKNATNTFRTAIAPRKSSMSTYMVGSPHFVTFFKDEY